MARSTNAQVSIELGVPAAESSRVPTAPYCIDPSQNQPESMQVYSYVHPVYSYVSGYSYPVVFFQPVEVPVTITSSPQASSGHVQQHDGGQQIIGPLIRNWSRYANVRPSEFSRRSHHAAGNSSNEPGSSSRRKKGISWRRGIGNSELPLLPFREDRSLTPFERLLQRSAAGRGPEELVRSDDAVGNLPQAQQLQAPSLPDVNRAGLQGGNGSSSDQGLSLSLSSHQQQPSAVQIQSRWSKEDLPTGVALSDSEKVTAEVNVDEEQHSRSLAGAGMDLSPFRTGYNSGHDVAGRSTKGEYSEYTDASSKAGHVVELRRSNLISTSKYLRPVQDILTGICKVATSRSKKQEEAGGQQSTEIGVPAGVHVGSSTPHGRGDPQVTSVASEDPVTSVALPTDASPMPVAVSHVGLSRIELTYRENRELQTMKANLGMMLVEVERRYKQYGGQMEILTNFFTSIAGRGTAASYTTLSVQAISRHFRCLRDAIVGRLRVVKIALGDEDAQRSRREETPGLHFTTDQQFRQQRALQLLGMLQQRSLRPVQRGLPEVAVSVLRAWLFENFLHPYPKGADKCLLAKQTGLTRSQVSNWFINARVRLWKPMVEEMYTEESREMEAQALLQGVGPSDARGKSNNLQDIHQENDGNSDDDMPLNTLGTDKSYVFMSDLNLENEEMRTAGAGAVTSEARSQERTRGKEQQISYERGSVNTSSKRSRDVDQEDQVANDPRRARPASPEELNEHETSSHEKNLIQTIEFSARGIFNKTNENFDGFVCTHGVPLCSNGRTSQQVEDRMHSVSHEDIQLEIVLGESTKADRPSEEHLANPGEDGVQMRSSKGIEQYERGSVNTSSKRSRDVDQEDQVANDPRRARPASPEELNEHETSSHEKNLIQTIEFSARGIFNKTNENFDGFVCTHGVPLCSNGRTSQQVEDRMHSVSHEDIQLEIVLGESTKADRPSEEHLANPGEDGVQMRSSKGIEQYERGSVNTSSKRSRDVDQEDQVANDPRRARPASPEELNEHETSSHEKNLIQTIEFSARGIFNKTNENFDGFVCTHGVPLCSNGRTSQQVEDRMHSVSHEDIQLEIVLGESTKADRPSEEHLANPGEDGVQMRSSKGIEQYERGSVNTSSKRSRDVDQEDQVANDPRRARPASPEELNEHETSSHEKNLIQTIEFSARGIFNKTNENFDGFVCTHGVPLCSNGRTSQQVEDRMHSVSHEDIQLEIVLGESTKADRPSEEHLANPGEDGVQMRSSKGMGSSVNGGVFLTLF